MWKANETTQYAMMGSRSCKNVSEMPGTIEGRAVRVYEGREGSSYVEAFAIVRELGVRYAWGAGTAAHV